MDESGRHERAARAFARQVRLQYGDAVKSVLLFGSTARRETRGVDSDVDLLVVLSEGVDRTEIERRVRELAYDVELEYGVVLSLVVTVESESDPGGPFFEHVRQDSVSLYG